MNRILLLIIGLQSFAISAKDLPVENDFQTNGNTTQAQAAAAIVKSQGYRCDSLSSFVIGSASTFGGGVKYTLYCNGYEYGYGIIDKGGRYVVTTE